MQMQHIQLQCIQLGTRLRLFQVLGSHIALLAILFLVTLHCLEFLLSLFSATVDPKVQERCILVVAEAMVPLGAHAPILAHPPSKCPDLGLTRGNWINQQ